MKPVVDLSSMWWKGQIKQCNKNLTVYYSTNYCSYLNLLPMKSTGWILFEIERIIKILSKENYRTIQAARLHETMLGVLVKWLKGPQNSCKEHQVVTFLTHVVRKTIVNDYIMRKIFDSPT